MAEPRVYLRQKWTRYLGELRPIHDIYVGNEIFPSPTPSVTPPVTPTSTNTPSVTQTNTQTNTPSVTQTNTPSVTIGLTPTATPTNTATQTNTPSITQSPYSVCPEQIIVQRTGDDFGYAGTYNRIYSNSATTFTTGYASGTTLPNSVFVTGSMPTTGLSYAVYERQSGSTYYTLIMRDQPYNPANQKWSWGIMRTSGTSFVNGGAWNNSQAIVSGNTDGINISGIYFPPNGITFNSWNISYPSICPTSTPTNTTTPSVTPTLTPTNTNTPSQTATMNPLCPEQLNYTTTFTAMTGADGSYQRLYSYTGGTFNFGYQTGTTFFTGSISGQNYVVFGRNDGTNFYSIIAFFVGSTFNYFIIQKSTGNYRHNGGTPVSSNNIGTTTDYEEISGVRVPKRGLYSTGSGNQYISYPSSCPTATPTSTLTQTPSSTPQVSPTSTPTMTNTQTSTPTNTPSITPSTSPPSCSVNMTVDNNTTGGGVDITGIEINGTPVTYVSGDNFSVLPGELGTFSTSITGVSVTMVVFYDASNANHAINVTDCDVNSFCCDNLTNGVGSCTFEGLAIDCTCTNGIQIIANNGDCL